VRKFHRISPEQRVVKVSKLLLCHICMKHLAGKECYWKAQADYKECFKSGCGMDQITLLNWALIVTRLFQVQVIPKSYPPGTQLFQLLQRVMMGKVDNGIAFDSRSNHMLVTEDYTKKMCLKKCC
jgi:hypothetical protein